MEKEKLIEKIYLEATHGLNEEWFVSGVPHWYSYVINLPQHLQTTYLTVLLENQVFNGGFHQYFANAYGQFARETIDALIDIGAYKKANLLEEALNIVKDNNLSDEEFRKEIFNKTLKKLFVDDDLYDPLGKLDNRYYDVENEDASDLLGKYLKPFNN